MGTLVCKIELDKKKGVTVEIENADGKITQTIYMDGTTITTTVKGSSETSTITQKADSIVIKCKDFTVDTETITMKSKKASKWTSQDVIDLKSTKDMTLHTDAKLTQSATSDAKLSSTANVSVEATNKLALKGMTAEMAGTTDVKIDAGTQLKMSAKIAAEMSGQLSAKVSGQTKLDLESTGMTNLKGSLTSVAGALVKLG